MNPLHDHYKEWVEKHREKIERGYHLKQQSISKTIKSKSDGDGGNDD